MSSSEPQLANQVGKKREPEQQVLLRLLFFCRGFCSGVRSLHGGCICAGAEVLGRVPEWGTTVLSAVVIAVLAQFQSTPPAQGERRPPTSGRSRPSQEVMVFPRAKQDAHNKNFFL